MNYQKIYADFVADRRGLESSLLRYEVHHIVPKAEGGTNESSNLIKLSFSDHLFSHKILWKIYGPRMALALQLMLDKEGYRGRRSRLRYKKARTEAAELRRESALRQHAELRAQGKLQRTNNGMKRTPEMNQKVSDSWTPERRQESVEHCRRINTAKRLDELRERNKTSEMRASSKARWTSEEKARWGYVMKGLWTPERRASHASKLRMNAELRRAK